MTELTQTPEAGPVVLSRIGVFGEMVTSFDGVRNTRASPIYLLGMQDDTQVLVPFVEMNLFQVAEEGEDEEEEALFSAVISIENMAYLVASLVEDFEQNCESLELVSRGALKPPADRVLYCRQKLDEIEEMLTLCRGHLEAMAAA